MLSTVAQVRAHCLQQMAELREQVFVVPPTTMEDFRRMQGAYRALSQLVEVLGPENPVDKDDRK